MMLNDEESGDVIDDCDRLFFFKQKKAYDIRLSLVGSEMCIRNSL